MVLFGVEPNWLKIGSLDNVLAFLVLLVRLVGFQLQDKIQYDIVSTALDLTYDVTYIGPPDDVSALHTVDIGDDVPPRHHLLLAFRAQENIYPTFAKREFGEKFSGDLHFREEKSCTCLPPEILFAQKQT